MIKIEFNMNMPKTCQDCPLFDKEFYYCHGRLQYTTWEVQDIYKHNLSRPDWCPLIEVKKEKEKLEYNMISNKLSSKEIPDFSPTGAKIY